MTYVSRDKEGQIDSVSINKTEVCHEFVDNDSDELKIAIMKFCNTDLQLLSSDLAMIRVIEDVIDVLINKSLISVNTYKGANKCS